MQPNALALEYQAEYGRATFDQRLRFLAYSPLQDWKPPYSRKLKGKCDGLVEIRFKADNVQQRPLGFFGVSRMTFTLLFWATEKNDKFVSKDACIIANRRRVQVEKDESTFSRVWNVE